jgi:nucleoid-associated protein
VAVGLFHRNTLPQVLHLLLETAIPVEFPISKATLDKYTHVVYKADNWQLKFDRNSLGEGIDAEIRFVEKDRKLIINNLSENAIEVIRQAIADKRDSAEIG